MKSIVVFDVCWTLYRSNTTVDFILFYLKKKRFVMFLFYRFLTYRPVSVLCRFAGVKNLREKIIFQLKGEKKNYLLKLSQEFYDSYLVNSKDEFLFDKFNKYKEKRGSVFLASASLDIVVSVIAKNEKVEYVSSTLEFVDGVCTGVLEYDATGNKYSLLKDAVKVGSFETMYSDNAEDKVLVKKFDFFYFISRSKILKKSKIVLLDNAND